MAKEDHDHDEVFDRGLRHDLKRLAKQQRNRRDILRWIGGAGLLGLVGGCIDRTVDELAPDASTAANLTPLDDPSTCSVIPEETAGPYPGDGSNGANALSQTGIVRSDIRSSFGNASGVASGVLLTVRLKLVNTRASCASLAGYAIYLWHCDAQGRYSMYSSGVTAENFLRGVQLTDDNGEVAFTTIFPGCYSGRWPHIHFEVYPAVPSSYATKLKTSQLALPEEACRAVYADGTYSGSLSNLNKTSLATDNIFSDGVASQLADVSGSTAAGYVAVLNVGINV